MQKGAKNAIHISIIVLILIAIAFTALMIILRYDEDGEKNMPFEVSKIIMTCITDGEDVEDKKNRWNKNISQNTDIYIYIQKNEEYKKTETIENVIIKNMIVSSGTQKGEIAFFRPSNNENLVFENKDEYKLSEIIFEGDMETKTQNLKISNQGGKVAFRCANLNVGNYVSNQGKEIKYDDILSKMKITYEDLKAVINFDLEIKLNSGKKYSATNIKLDIPTEDVINKGTTGKEITDLKNIVFKRIEN